MSYTGIFKIIVLTLYVLITTTASDILILYCQSITKTYLYNFDPLKPHFHIVKLGFSGYALFFLFLLKNIDSGYPLEPPRRGGSNEYPQSIFWAEIRKISECLSEKFQFFDGENFNIFE